MKLNPKVMTVVLVFIYSAFLSLIYELDAEAKLANKGEVMSVIGSLSLEDVKKKSLLESFDANADFTIHHQNGNSSVLDKLVIDVDNKRVSVLAATGQHHEYISIIGHFPRIMETENQYFIALSVTGVFLLALFFLFFAVMLRKVKNLNLALKEQNKYLENAANIDSLTQCYNRRHFKLNKERYFSVSIRDKLAVTVGVLDIDFFKDINDVYGHDAGDIVLKDIASFIQRKMPAGSPGLYRFGGEEFVIVLIGLSKSEVDDWLDGLYGAMKRNIIPVTKGKEVTFSVGMAKINSDDEAIEMALKRADEALYCAKNNGRNQYYWNR